MCCVCLPCLHLSLIIESLTVGGSHGRLVGERGFVFRRFRRWPPHYKTTCYNDVSACMYVCVFYNDAWSLVLWEQPCLLSFPLSPELLTFHLSECAQIYVHTIYLLCVTTCLASKHTHTEKENNLSWLGSRFAACCCSWNPDLSSSVTIWRFRVSGAGLLSSNR